MIAIITFAAAIATILGLGWMIYAHYKPHTANDNRTLLNQSLPPKVVADAIEFLDWVQKNPRHYIHNYPSFVAIRPYLTILEQDGFINKSDTSNMQGDVFELTAQGQKALLTAGLKLV
jgi:hypothetical protein